MKTKETSKEVANLQDQVKKYEKQLSYNDVKFEYFDRTILINNKRIYTILEWV